jgi:hypothetical protein
VRALVAGAARARRTLTDQPIVWCDLNDEQAAIEKVLAEEGVSVASLYGKQTTEDERLALLRAWKARERAAFLQAGDVRRGVNLQQSHSMIFAGIGFKFRDFIQAVHRIYRFLQAHDCDVHFVLTDAELEVKRALEAKWAKHDELVAQMTALVRAHGLARTAIAPLLARATAVERHEASGANWHVFNNDCVRETRNFPTITSG